MAGGGNIRRPDAGTGPATAFLIVTATVFLAGCASRNALQSADTPDPLEPFNRAMYRFNEAGDKYILRPVAVGYTRALPPQIRSGVHNVFANLVYPVTIANDFLQGKFRQTGRDGARFLLNSTVGLAGIFDPATRIGLRENDEDFGQTLGKWGVAEGPYLVLPVFGPYTVRDAVGAAVDSPLTPFLNFTNGDATVKLGAWAIYQVDRRSGLLDVDQQVFEAYDPYIFVRDAYLQNIRYRVHDGNPPEDDSYLDDPSLDDPEPGESAPDDSTPDEATGE